MKTRYTLSILLLFLSFALIGQTAEVNQRIAKADKYFSSLSYVKSEKLYKRLSKKDSSAHVLGRLADSYYYNSKMKEASYAYKTLLEKNPKTGISSDYYLRYAHALRGIGNYSMSDRYMNKYQELKQQENRAKNFVANQNKLASILETKNYELKNLKQLNTKYSDFGVGFYGNVLVFSSAKREKSIIGRKYAWNGQPFLDLYVYPKDSLKNENSTQEPYPMYKPINSKYHESSIAYSAKTGVLYFTRNNEGYKKGIQKENSLKIYRAEKVGNQWGNIQELPFNSNNYSVGHPALSQDEQRLYFTSDMPGGFGETDLWYVAIQENNTYGEPINLGAVINTEGKELFPYIANDNSLYFSSDGHFGMGGLDVFVSRITTKSKTKESTTNNYSTPENLQSPVNSRSDDFGFVIDTKQKQGYVSSNRQGGMGDDDIYGVTGYKAPEKAPEPVVICKQTVSGIVQDKKLQNPLEGAQVVLKQEDGTILNDTLVGADAKFTYTLPCNQKYTVTATKEYYKPDTASFETTATSSLELDLDFNLEIADDFEYNERNELIIKIKPIFFDYNSSKIRGDAAAELDRIIKVMKKYPKLVIESGSHTDARGRASYNESLSRRRAESTVDYIIRNGIPSSRISGKGYGEVQLVNRCSDGIQCSDQEHQANRRTEFVIVKR